MVSATARGSSALPAKAMSASGVRSLRSAASPACSRSTSRSTAGTEAGADDGPADPFRAVRYDPGRTDIAHLKLAPALNVPRSAGFVATPATVCRAAKLVVPDTKNASSVRLFAVPSVAAIAY